VANAWGLSWGNPSAWGVSWGSGDVARVAVGKPRRQYTREELRKIIKDQRPFGRERWEEMKAAAKAQQELELAAQEAAAGKRKRALERAAQEAAEALEAAQLDELAEAADFKRLANLIESANRASKTAEVIKRAQLVTDFAKAMQQELDEEEEAIAMMLL
jgi:hypothetical protein